jgi:hypothetical protein
MRALNHVLNHVLNHATRLCWVIATVALMLVGTVAQSYAETGTVRLRLVKAGFIVGAGGGSGTLTVHNRTYRLSVGGVGIGMIGVAGVDLAGTAYNLFKPSDIAGTYSAAGAGVAILAGGKVIRLQNNKGVIIELHGAQMGLDLSLNLSGMTITLQYSSLAQPKPPGV